MTTILSFWYLQSPGWAYSSFVRSVRIMEGRIGVADMLRNIRKPLFQDYTTQGRIIGVLIRLVRVCLGCIAYAMIAVLYSMAFLLWILFPLICLISVIGSVAGTNYNDLLL